MEKIPQAEEFIRKHFMLHSFDLGVTLTVNSAVTIMKEFAELHVKAALEAAAEKGLVIEEHDLYAERNYISESIPTEIGWVRIHKPSILSAYPEENIK